jgi:hypothetical protein
MFWKVLYSSCILKICYIIFIIYSLVPNRICMNKPQVESDELRVTGLSVCVPYPQPVPYRVPWFVQKSWISVNILEPFKKCNALLRFILRQGLVFCVKHLSNFWIRFIFFYVRYSTQLHLPPLRFHCVGGCWDRTQDCCDIGIDSHSTRSHLLFCII